jgi:tRNA G26 N,N-dimethylase Trm1
MAPKKTCKLVQETMVEEPTQDLDVPSKAIKEEEQEDYEEQKDCENHNDHKNEQEQPTTIFFTLKQLEVLLKMNRPNLTELVMALKGGSLKGVRFKLSKPGNFDRTL